MKKHGPLVWPASTGLIQTGGGPVNRLRRKRQANQGRQQDFTPRESRRRAPRTRHITAYSAVVLGTTVVEPVAAVLLLAGVPEAAMDGPDFT